VIDRKTLNLVLIAAFATGIGGALLGFGYVKSGIYNVGASKPHTDFTEWLTHETMIHSVRSHAKGIESPGRATAIQVTRGFCLYDTHCVACHGAAAVPRQRWVSGLEPAPPYLLDAADRWKPHELFWIVKNGIKMTGMPSWRNELQDAEIWDVVAYLEATKELPPQTYLALRAERRCGSSIALPSSGSSPIPRP
jgi:mono/diheme cytochrome c family protein